MVQLSVCWLLTQREHWWECARVCCLNEVTSALVRCLGKSSACLLLTQREHWWECARVCCLNEVTSALVRCLVTWSVCLLLIPCLNAVTIERTFENVYLGHFVHGTRPVTEKDPLGHLGMHSSSAHQSVAVPGRQATQRPRGKRIWHRFSKVSALVCILCKATV